MMQLVWLILVCCCGRRTLAGVEFGSNGAQLILTNVTDTSFTVNITQKQIENVIDLSVQSSNISLTDIILSFTRISTRLEISYLDMTGGYLNIIAENEFLPIQKVSEIILTENRIERLEQRSFHNLTYLFNVNLSYNLITKLEEDTFTSLYNLAEIHLQHNNISLIHQDAFALVPLLNTVYLNNNNLQSVPYKALDMTSITALYLSNNDITEITEDVKGFKHIQILDLSRNKIEHVHRHIAQLKMLNKLYLFDNKLTTLPASVKPLLSNYIDLTGNPWDCICSLTWLIEWTQTVNRSQALNTLKCVTPYDINMSLVNIRSLSCDTEVSSPLSPLLIAILVFIPTLAVFAFLISMWLVRNRFRICGKTRRLQMVLNGIYQRPGVADSRSTNLNLSYDGDLRSQDVGFTGVNEYGKIRLGRVIGRGAFGDVYEAMASDENKKWIKVAVKKLRDYATTKDQSSIMQEFQSMKEIGGHPNIINVIGSGIINGSVIMVMELAEHGDLLSYLQVLEKREHHSINSLDRSEERFYLQHKHPVLFVFMWQVAKGMEYLSRLKVVHRDLAVRNILISKGPVAKISDFGLSRDIYISGYYYQKTCGRLPYKWMSPETLTAGKSTTHSDVWSYGVLLWEIVTLGASPYPGIPPNMLLDMLNVGYRMRKPSLCPETIYDIMVKCWEMEPTNRLRFDSIVETLDTFIQTGSNKEYLDIYNDENTQINDQNIAENTRMLDSQVNDTTRIAELIANENTRVCEPSINETMRRQIVEIETPG